MKSEFIDCNAAAEELKVTSQFLRKLAREGKVPSYRLSARILRFNLDEVRECMRKNAVAVGNAGA
ncbi:MAG: hypothetical protein Q8S00_26410 [Deltaproteobacteria bacterium]|nr:hypothetical protein [Deltaproteobacteria bacterium]